MISTLTTKQAWLPFMELKQRKVDRAQILKTCCSRVKCFIGMRDCFGSYVGRPNLLSFRCHYCFCKSREWLVIAETDGGFYPTPSKVCELISVLISCYISLFAKLTRCIVIGIWPFLEDYREIKWCWEDIKPMLKFQSILANSRALHFWINKYNIGILCYVYCILFYLLHL